MARDVLVSIEQFTEQTAKSGKEYFSFWVRLNFNGRFVAISGWKYFPDSGTLSTPSQGKGDGKFVNTTKTNSLFYTDILEEAYKKFGGPEHLAESLKLKAAA